MDLRPDLARTQNAAWQRLARPGTWLSGAERVAIAAETRHALHCPFCAARRAALSPLAVSGSHTSLGVLDATDVEAIHRIRTDSGRLGATWFERASGGDHPRYIELVSVVVVTVAIDTFRGAAGLEQWPLPVPLPGTPSRALPPGAKPGPGWTATLRPDDVGPGDPDLYCEDPGPRSRSGAHILLALSLVPHSMIHWWDLFEPMYMAGPEMRQFDTEFRAISHAQLEMLAARVAALNQCEY
jgi:hypothetical protein